MYRILLSPDFALISVPNILYAYSYSKCMVCAVHCYEAGGQLVLCGVLVCYGMCCLSSRHNTQLNT